MWNSGIPYVLKQFIDLITQPGWLFGFTPEDCYTGLFEGKKAAAIYTSGVYSEGVPIQYGADFHATFFNDWLRFAGITDLTQVRWQPTILTTTREDDRSTALKQAAEAGRTF
jgi:FMN-dependent NADH-azoreductase